MLMMLLKTHEKVRFDDLIQVYRVYIYIHLHMIEESICVLKRKVLQVEFSTVLLLSLVKSCGSINPQGFRRLFGPYQPHQSLTPSQHMIKFRGGLRDIWRGRNLRRLGFLWSNFAHFQVIPDKRYRLVTDAGILMVAMGWQIYLTDFWSIISFWDTKTMLIHKLVTPGNYHWPYLKPSRKWLQITPQEAIWKKRHL